jgi:hypothetical protein
MDKVNSQHRISVWDKQVSTFLQLLESARPQAALLNSLTLQDLKAWPGMIGLSRPSRLVGQKRTIDDIKSYFVKDDIGKMPDGMVFDLHERTIYVIEVARTFFTLQSRTKNPGDWFAGQHRRISMEAVTLGIWNDEVSAR